MRAALAGLIVAAALAGCGGGDEQQTAAPSTPAPAPSAATEAPTETPTTAASPTPTATTQPSPTQNPEDQPGGAGDEEAVRVPAEFTVGADLKLSPQQISIPAFFQIEFIVHNKSSLPVVARFVGRRLMTVEPDDNASTTVAGRKKGSYVFSAEPGGDAVIVTGVEPGP